MDAAYGGFFALTERGRAAMSGLERADSIVLDPHKGLFMPYGTGSLLVKDAAALRRSHSVSGALHAGHAGRPGLRRLLRDFPRAFAQLPGARGLARRRSSTASAAFRKSLDEKLDLAREAADAVRAIPDMTIVAEPELSLFAFRLDASRSVHRGRESLEPRADGARERTAKGAPDGHSSRRRLRAPHVHPQLPDARGPRPDGARGPPRGGAGGRRE